MYIYFNFVFNNFIFFQRRDSNFVAFKVSVLYLLDNGSIIFADSKM